jgi:hypothetical protein
MCGLGVDFLDLEIDFGQIFGELVFASLDVRVNFLHFGRDFGVGVFKLDKGMLGHLTGHVITEDFAVDT